VLNGIPSRGGSTSFFLFFPLPFVHATGGSISNNPSCNSADDGCDPALPLSGCVVVTTDPVADGPLPSDPLAVVSSLAGCVVVATDSVADGPLPGDPFSMLLGNISIPGMILSSYLFVS